MAPLVTLAVSALYKNTLLLHLKNMTNMRNIGHRETSELDFSAAFSFTREPRGRILSLQSGAFTQ